MDSDFDKLAVKVLAGLATLAEQEQLKELLAADPDLAEEFDKLKVGAVIAREALLYDQWQQLKKAAEEKTPAQRLQESHDRLMAELRKNKAEPKKGEPPATDDLAEAPPWEWPSEAWKRLVAAVRSLAAVVRVEESYDWGVPADCPVAVPDHLSTPYEQNRYLKSALEPGLHSDSDFSAHYWVIKEWGGIRSFKVNKSNNEKIRTFRRELEKGRLTRPTFNVISSLSKLASFWNHEQYAIYDSRAVFALNWLLIKHIPKAKLLFPQPQGRNKGRPC